MKITQALVFGKDCLAAAREGRSGVRGGQPEAAEEGGGLMTVTSRRVAARRLADTSGGGVRRSVPCRRERQAAECGTPPPHTGRE